MESESPEIQIYNERFSSSPTRTRKNYKNRSSPSLNIHFNEDDEDDPELTALLRLIECPVCKDVPVPPIFNCSNGHFICNPCRSRLVTQNCAYCYAEMTLMRNFPLESLVTTPAVKCDYIENGCSKKLLSLGEYEEHVRKCWAKYWRPGKICYKSEMSDEEEEDFDNICNEIEELSPCPKCEHQNSPRKISCQLCYSRLRPATPMFPSPSHLNGEQSEYSEYEYVTSVWKDLKLAFQVV